MSLEEDDVWGSKECAGLFKCSPKHFLREIRFQDGFPPQLSWSIGKHPKWSKLAVKAWALRPDYAQAA